MSKPRSAALALDALADPDRVAVEALAHALSLPVETFWRRCQKPTASGAGDEVEAAEGRLVRLPLQRFERIVGDFLRLDLRELTALEELRMPRWRLARLELPRTVRRLDISWNALEAFPLEGLATLEELRAEHALRYLEEGEERVEVDLREHTALRVADVGRLLAPAVLLPAPSRIEELSVHVNRLSRLVLPDSPALRTLSCSGNRDTRGGASALQEIDARAAPALQRLFCGYSSTRSLRLAEPSAELTHLGCECNQLVEVPDAAQTPALSSLACWNNPLGALDLSGRAALRVLDASCVGLRELDLSGAPSLRVLNVCARPPVSRFEPDRVNRLERLDVSATPHLEELHVLGNPLRELDLTSLPLLHTLSVDEVGELGCTEAQRESILALRYRFGLSAPNCPFKKLDPWQLHDLARRVNWDDGTKLPLRILGHPSCDLGTALWLYWHADPHFYTAYAHRKAVPAHARKGWDFVKLVEQKVAAGELAHARVRFDPRCDRTRDPNGFDWTAPTRPVERVWHIPEAMKQSVGGPFTG